MITMGAVGAAFREQSTGSREWKLVKKVGHLDFVSVSLSSSNFKITLVSRMLTLFRVVFQLPRGLKFMLRIL